MLRHTLEEKWWERTKYLETQPNWSRYFSVLCTNSPATIPCQKTGIRKSAWQHQKTSHLKVRRSYCCGSITASLTVLADFQSLVSAQLIGSLRLQVRKKSRIFQNHLQSAKLCSRLLT